MFHSYKYVDLFQVNKKICFIFYICVFCLKIQIVGLFCCMQKLHKRYLSGVRQHSYNLVHRSPIRQKLHFNIKTS